MMESEAQSLVDSLFHESCSAFVLVTMVEDDNASSVSNQIISSFSKFFLALLSSFESASISAVELSYVSGRPRCISRVRILLLRVSMRFSHWFLKVRK